MFIKVFDLLYLIFIKEEYKIQNLHSSLIYTKRKCYICFGNCLLLNMETNYEELFSLKNCLLKKYNFILEIKMKSCLFL